MTEDQQDNRRPYEASCRLLQELGYLDAREGGSIPPIPDHLPQPDDEEPLGVYFFRTFIGDGDLENMTLPRTFIQRSEVGPTSFRNCDLSESNLCWNDFTDVSFEDADLSGSDLRASVYMNVRFVRTNLAGADLRGATFDSCDFSDANMQGTRLTRKDGKRITLSKEQRQAIDWQKSVGDEPPGG